MIEPIEQLNQSIKDVKATWVFLFVFYDFRYNHNKHMIEAKEKPYTKSPCNTNLSIQKDFSLLEKPILYTWSQYLKRQGVNVSMKRILTLIRLHLFLGNISIRLKPKWI